LGFPERERIITECSGGAGRQCRFFQRESILASSSGLIIEQFLLPCVTVVVQSMDQGVIASLKQSCQADLFRTLATENDNIILLLNYSSGSVPLFGIRSHSYLTYTQIFHFLDVLYALVRVKDTIRAPSCLSVCMSRLCQEVGNQHNLVYCWNTLCNIKNWLLLEHNLSAVGTEAVV
jgi:hypothetical protein